MECKHCPHIWNTEIKFMQGHDHGAEWPILCKVTIWVQHDTYYAGSQSGCSVTHIMQGARSKCSVTHIMQGLEQGAARLILCRVTIRVQRDLYYAGSRSECSVTHIDLHVFTYFKWGNCIKNEFRIKFRRMSYVIKDIFFTDLIYSSIQYK